MHKLVVSIFIILSLYFFFSCQESTEVPILQPTGTKGAQYFASDYSSIQFLGNFNGWNIDDFENTKMALVNDYEWYMEITLSAGTIQFKFVTDRSWDNPQDFGSLSSYSGLEGYADLVSGTDTHLSADIPADGVYEIRLNEKTKYYSITAK